MPKVRFVEAVIHGSLVVSNRKKSELLQELRRKGFKAFPKTTKVVAAAAAGEAEEDPAGSEGEAGDYDYLLSMPIWNLTMEKVGLDSSLVFVLGVCYCAEFLF